MKFAKKKFFETVQKYSYFKDEVDWSRFEKKLGVIPEEVTNAEPINKLLRELDQHSFVIPSLKESETAAETYQNDSRTSRVLQDAIGYLELPGFYSPNNDRKELHKNYETIVSALDTLSGCSTLILDISNNSGGNMYPWLAALAPLYDINTVGYFEYKYKSEKDPWSITSHGVSCGERKWFDEINTSDIRFEKIAILISEKTVSSGEAIALSFMGQANARLFGEKTGGFTTGNESFEIGDLTLWLSTGIMQDRNGKSYPEGISPEEPTAHAQKEARRWLAKN